MLRLVVLTILFCGSLADDPTCPKVKGSDDFDFVKHAAGKWYSIAMYDNLLHPGVNCIFVEYADRYENGTVKYYNSHLDNGNVVTWVGYGMLAEDGENQIITQNFITDEGVLVPLNVLITDADKYAILYKCVYDESAKTRTEYVWVISRTRVLPLDVKTIIDDFINNSDLIDTKHLIWEDFTQEQCELIDGLTFTNK